MIVARVKAQTIQMINFRPFQIVRASSRRSISSSFTSTLSTGSDLFVSSLIWTFPEYSGYFKKKDFSPLPIPANFGSAKLLLKKS